MLNLYHADFFLYNFSKNISWLKFSFPFFKDAVVFIYCTIVTEKDLVLDQKSMYVIYLNFTLRSAGWNRD